MARFVRSVHRFVRVNEVDSTILDIHGKPEYILLVSFKDTTGLFL